MADKEAPISSAPEPAASTDPATFNTSTAEAAKDEVTKPTDVAPTTSEPSKDAADMPATDEKAAATKEMASTTTPSSTPFADFAKQLPSILKEIEHDEMWGVKLFTTSPVESHIPTQIILQKFLNANDGDLVKAVDQFKSALKWRKEKKPLDLLNKTFKSSKFGNLGVVTIYPVKSSPIPEVFTWNLYGNVKDRMDEVFTPLDDFLTYRIALQELGLQHLNLPSATTPITATHDPYKMIQVHDYKNVSFFRQPPSVKAASTEVIKQFSMAYPELLKEKFFVNVPAVMGYLYALIKLFVAEKTRKKFHPMANGANLAAEFPTPASDIDAKLLLPKEYGGKQGNGNGTVEGFGSGEDGVRVENLRFE